MKEVLFLFLLLTSSIYSQTKPSNIAGAYQWCPFHCEVYKINADFTFDYLIDGDLYNNQRTKGNWQFDGENKIHLKTPKRKLISKVIEKADGRDKISVKVTDNAGGAFAGIVIRVKFNDKEYKYITDENGICDIFKSNKIEINYLDSSETYEIKNPRTTELDIELESLHEPSIDDTFLIKNGTLCKIFENGEISENCHRKLKQKTAEKLFPKK